jgi:hypothetical protein
MYPQTSCFPTKLAAGFIALILATAQCNNDKACDYDGLLKCHNDNPLDVALTKNKLLGAWRWQYAKSCGEGGPGLSTALSKATFIDFKENGNGILTTDGAIENFTWDISGSDNRYKFTTQPYISQLAGDIVFCDDMLMCHNSSVDGLDNFYRKSK